MSAVPIRSEGFGRYRIFHGVVMQRDDPACPWVADQYFERCLQAAA
ncbi:MAG: hypothetical protein NTV73_06675 [Hyphomicrobiales bacterium]|nr:hypothetical protein [Hyphomicrobiales bacterium]